jgi:hypothetical protein
MLQYLDKTNAIRDVAYFSVCSVPSVAKDFDLEFEE